MPKFSDRLVGQETTEQAENWGTLQGGVASVSVEIQTVPIVVETVERIQKGT